MIDKTLVVQTLAARGIAPDASQRLAIAAILALLASGARRGVYCYGPPGRGKSVVVDTIFALAPCAKRRIHFHEFLREIARRQREMPANGGDRLVMATQHWLAGIELLCFDEFHVHDIADSFLVGRFLDTALGLGIRIVLTSNYAPDGLLPDPQYHERFRPTIDRIEREFAIIHFDGARDYRFNQEQPVCQRFFAPLNGTTAHRLLQIFATYENGQAPQPATVQVAGRPLQVRAHGTILLWADFDALCMASRSYLDYLELAERWQGLIIDQVCVAACEAGALQRFIWLVDIFYDRRHALFIAADHPIAEAISQLDGAHDLARTLSRLAEIQSPGYARTAANVYPSSTPTTLPP